VEFLGLTIARTKTLDLRLKQMSRSLSPVWGMRSWWSWLQEATTGGWQRNEDVSVDTALSNPTLFACVTLIASDIGKLRPMLVEQDTNGFWSEVDSAAFSPVLRKPNHYQTRVGFYQWWVMSKLNHGNTYVLKARDDRNVVSAMYILDPSRVSPLVAEDGSVFYQLVHDELNQSEPIIVPAREIIHDVCCPLFHPLVGVSPIYAAGYPATQGLTIRTNSQRFFSNASQPGGILTAPGPMPLEKAQAISAWWQENFSGDNTGKIAVMADGLHYEPMAVSAEQSELVEQLKMTDEDIAKCYHMPRHKIGIGPDPTYNNIEALNLQYYADCLQIHIEQMEILLDEGLGLTAMVGKTLGVEFDRDQLFQMDTSTRIKTALDAIRAGMSPNEVRARFLDVGPAEGGDSPMVQQQMFSLEALQERDESKPFAKPEPPPPALEASQTAEMAAKFLTARMVYQKMLDLDRES
jgi:HK97 family phage portal protein